MKMNEEPRDVYVVYEYCKNDDKYILHAGTTYSKAKEIAISTKGPKGWVAYRTIQCWSENFGFSEEDFKITLEGM